jgi:DNA-binding LacI/PurR family transcriptional regulator
MTTTSARAVVMADVAREAGVSIMTVSRVLHGHPNVAPTTRRDVERAVQRLGYRPNATARALVTGRTQTIGVVSVETPHYGPASTLFGIEAAARAEGLFVTFAVVRGRAGTVEMREAIDHLRAASVDGLVVVAPLRAARRAVEQIDVELPVVVLHGTSRATRGATVAIDQAEGARLATRHLIELGHREIRHVRGPRDWPEADVRARTWQEEMRAHGLRAATPLVGDWTARSGFDAGRRIARDRAATAVFVANDQMALGVLLALREAGRRVPEDVSVVGFDDVPEAEFYAPPLTTIRQDFAELGRRCVRRLNALITSGGEANGADVVVPTLVERASAAATR